MKLAEIKEPEPEGNLNTMSGFWLLMNGKQEQGQLNSMFKSLVKHMSWDGHRWSPARVCPHARLDISVEICGKTYSSHGLRCPARTTATLV